MGEFNDEPFDPSLVQHALSTRQPDKVLGATTAPRLWNLMWPAAADATGSFYWQNFANLLDQLLVNKNMIRTSSPLRADPDTVEILQPPGMVNPGTYPTPVPFGGMGRPVNPAGFSDHYPIAVTVHEADQVLGAGSSSGVSRGPRRWGRPGRGRRRSRGLVRRCRPVDRWAGSSLDSRPCWPARWRTPTGGRSRCSAAGTKAGRPTLF